MAKHRIVVVGGGITGLAAAHRVLELARERQLDVDVQLLEAAGRVGGNISTSRREGFLIEGGPDSFITQKPAGVALCSRLGIADQIIGTNPACRRTFIVRDGRMHPVPEGFLLLAPTRIWPFVTSRLFSWPAKLRMAMDLVLPRKDHGAEGDESLADFVRRRFGQEALERVAQPMVGGIYTADPADFGLRATMPRFLEMENRHRSIIKAMRAETQQGSKDSGARYSLFVSFREGMRTLIDGVASRLAGAVIRTSCPVKKIEPVGHPQGSQSSGLDPRWKVYPDAGASINAHAVILACPSHATARIIRALDEPMSDELAAIRYASSATMSLAFRRDQFDQMIDGFGFVVPALEKRTILAVTVSSTKFENRAPAGFVLLRAFLGGAMQPQVLEYPDAKLTDLVMKDLRELMSVRGEPLFAELHRWPMSMPQYPVGHLKRAAKIRQALSRHTGLFVAGNAFGGVGIPDCISSGETAATDAINAISVTG